jgi:hypothetical protein
MRDRLNSARGEFGLDVTAEELVHPGQRYRRIVLGGQIQRRHVASPGEREPQRKDSRPRVRAAARPQRHHCPHPRLGLGRGQHRPPAEAVPDQPDPRHLEPDVRSACGPGGCPAAEQMVEEETHVGHPAGDHGIDPRGPFGLRFAAAAGQFRRDHLGVIQRGDDVPVTGQVRTQSRSWRAGPLSASCPAVELPRRRAAPKGDTCHRRGRSPRRCVVFIRAVIPVRCR